MKATRVIVLLLIMTTIPAAYQSENITIQDWKTLQTPNGPNRLGLLQLKQLNTWKKTLNIDYSIGNDSLILSVIFINMIIGLIYRALLCRNVAENGLISRPINLLTGTLRAISIIHGV